MELAYSFRGSVNYHHGRKYGTVQADLVLEEPRVLHLELKAARRRLSSTLGRTSAWDLKAHPYSDALPPTRPHLQTVPLPGPSVFTIIVIMITVIIELRFY